MAPVVSVRNLAKSFGAYSVLDGCSVAINEGEVYGLVGLNGAGKTTLIRLLLGLLKADSGAISVLGADPWHHDAALHQCMGVVLDHDGFWGNLTFDQNMRIFSEAKGISWNAAAAYIEEYWNGTSIYKNKKAVKFFSRGQRMQCALCRAFIGWPSIFFFDEPAVALDVDAYDHFKNLVAEARRRGATFLISSHQLDAIGDLAGRVGMLRDKQVTELALGIGSGNVLWSLAADETAAWGVIIERTCGTTPDCIGGEWRFEAGDAATTIPLLIKRLVEAGCSIKSVAPVQADFSAAIRNEYRRKSTQEPEIGKDRRPAS